MKEVSIITLFPDFFASPLETGLLGKAVGEGLFSVRLISLRDYSKGTYQRCDDYPYGGGSGMVLMPAPLIEALSKIDKDRTSVLLTTPSGKLMNQEMVKSLADLESICIICGHYEGVDQRIIDKYVDLELSIGDYVLSGGEYAALVILDAIARYCPGFMSNRESLLEESFEGNLLEYPHYTRPATIEGMTVPEVLLSGNHGLIQKWRHEKRIEKTRAMRPDLYERYLSSEEGVE